MSKRELNSFVALVLPYGEKQAIALLMAGLLGFSHGAFDAPHLHVEPAPMETAATVMVAATNTASAVMTWTSGSNR
jgi:hypothetical protein